MSDRFRTFLHAIHNPQPREQVLIAYLLVAMSVAAVYQTPQLTDPMIGIGLPEHLAPLPILIAGSLLLSWPFRNLKRFHLWFLGKTLTTDEGYAGLARLANRLAKGARLGKLFLKAKGFTLLAIGAALLSTWLTTHG
jgi:hypothetical protein